MSSLRTEPDLSASLSACIANRTLCRATQYKDYYPAMCESALLISTSDMDRPLSAIAHLVYGWMPTILKRVDQKVQNKVQTLAPEQEREIVQQALGVKTSHKAAALLDAFQTEFGWAPVNRSWIGTSKALHFISPAVFPIWDRRVAQNFGIKSFATVNSRHMYCCYLLWAHQNKQRDEVTAFSELHTRVWEYPVDRIRAIELLLFFGVDAPKLTDTICQQSGLTYQACITCPQNLPC